MKNALRVMALMALAVLIGVPAAGGELKVTGIFENILPHLSQNLSRLPPVGDADVTRNSDNLFFARERFRGFFNFIASDDLRGVFAIELDSAYGAPSRDIVFSRCIAAEQCGFRNAIDINNFELKQLYVDFRIPQLPFGNRVRVGGFPADVTPLHSHLVYTSDAGGLDVRLNFIPEVSLLLHYIQLEEDVERFPGSVKIGEDYLTGGTLMLKPAPGLDLHLLGVHGHLQAPFGAILTGIFGPFNGIQGDPTNVVTEDRYYLGFDSRYRLGNLSIEPTFIYLFGTRKFCAPNSQIPGPVGGAIGGAAVGAAVNCTSPVTGGVREIDLNAFEAQLLLQYTMGAWLLAGKFAYTSGNETNDDINNRPLAGVTRPADVKGFRPLGIDILHRFGEWFEVLGRSEVDVLGINSPFGAGKQGTLDRFGWVVFGAKAEYKATDKLTLEGAVGAFWTAEETACPASIRTSATVCGGPQTSAGTPAFDFTGNSRYAGTEIDVGLRYTILPGLSWTPRFGWGFLGDAFQTQNRNVQDAWVLINRLLYTF